MRYYRIHCGRHVRAQATGDLDRDKAAVLPIVKRILQDTKAFLDTAARADKLKTITGIVFYIARVTP